MFRWIARKLMDEMDEEMAAKLEGSEARANANYLREENAWLRKQLSDMKAESLFWRQKALDKGGKKNV